MNIDKKIAEVVEKIINEKQTISIYTTNEFGFNSWKDAIYQNDEILY